MLRLCSFRLLSISSLLLFVSCCLTVFCVERLTMTRSRNEKVKVYKVPADKRELPGIPESVLSSFEPHRTMHDNEGQSGTLVTTADHSRDGSTKCPDGHMRKGKGLCVECSAGKFILPGWIACRHLLTCDDFKLNVRVGQSLPVDAAFDPSGYMHDWTHYNAEWEGLKAIMVCPSISMRTSQPFTDLIHTFHTAQSPLHAIGFCPEDSCVLYSAPHASKWVPLLSVLKDSRALPTLRPTWQLWYTRLTVVLNVIQILAQLHSTGRYAVCSGTTVEEIVQQFLVNSENGQVSLVGFSNVVSTAASAKAGYSGTCSKWREQSVQGFFAPEETNKAIRGMYSHRTFIDHHLYLASRSTADLWKVPDIADFILAGTPGGELVLDYLSALHLQCKSVKPKERPSFPQVLSTYQETLRLLSSVSMQG